MVFMQTISIETALGKIELLEYVPSIYINIEKQANKLLPILRKGLTTWVSPELRDIMNINLWVYNDIRVNAFAHNQGSSNYIALSVGLLQIFWNAAYDFVLHPCFNKVITISENKKSDFINKLFLLMVNFVVAHEYGHIAHGHLLYPNSAPSTLCEYMYSENKKT